MAKSHEMLEEELSYITLPNIQKRQSFWGGKAPLYTTKAGTTRRHLSDILHTSTPCVTGW